LGRRRSGREDEVVLPDLPQDRLGRGLHGLVEEHAPGQGHHHRVEDDLRIGGVILVDHTGQVEQLPGDKGDVDGAADTAALPDVLVFAGDPGDGDGVTGQPLVQLGCQVRQRRTQGDDVPLGLGVLVADGQPAQPVVH
jgi:hypothetical protein